MTASATVLHRRANISPDGVYRWLLTRTWHPPGPMDTWVMLNPSTADAEVDDPTIRRCIAFSRGWGAGSLAVVNLFALRSTDPAVLATHPDPVGDRNDHAITTAVDIAVRSGGRVIAAWGANKMAAIRGRQVAGRVHAITREPIVCLGMTAAGAPRHPLYVRADTVPTPWGAR